MDISKLVLKDPLEKQVTPASSSFSPEGIVEQVPLLVLLKFFLSLNVKFFFPFDIIHTILLLREAVVPPRIHSLSVMTQTESGPPLLPNKSSSLPSSFVR